MDINYFGKNTNMLYNVYQNTIPFVLGNDSSSFTKYQKDEFLHFNCCHTLLS